MDDEIQIVRDGTSIALVGEPVAIERRLRSEGLWDSSSPLDLKPLKRLVGLGADVTRAVSEVNAKSGRWLKLTDKSARLVKEHGLMDAKAEGESHIMVGAPGLISSWLQAETTPGAMLTNPALVSGVTGLMAQVAAKQAMAEITDYLKGIDAKVGDVLRKMDDAAVADLYGLQSAIDRAMTLLDATGEIDEITWSTVDQAHVTIGKTQEYALSQLDAIAAKLKSSKVGQLATEVDEAKPEVRKWLGVLAHCFRLHEAVDILEIDRRLGHSPDNLDDYWQAMRLNRQNRRQVVLAHTEALLEAIDRAAGVAADKMVRARKKALAVLDSGNHVAVDVGSFHSVLEIESEARSWDPPQLGRMANIGSLAVQGAKDAVPIVSVVVGSVVIGAGAIAKSRDDESSS